MAIQVESNAKEAYSQEATLVREQTALYAEIENDADAVAKKARPLPQDSMKCCD